MQLFIDTGRIDGRDTNNVLKECYSWTEVMAASQVHSKTGLLNSSVARFLLDDFLSNTFNLISAAFLFIGFQVLYMATLGSDNRTSLINYFVPFSIAALIIMWNIISVFIGFEHNIANINLYVSTHMVRLAGGIYNGVAMSLLFSRFIAMEYFFKEALAW